MKYDGIHRKRISIFSIAAGVLVLSLGRFYLLLAQTSPQLVEAAKKEGRLVWYEAMSQSDANALVQQFNKQYPLIKVEIFRLGSAALLSRVLAEHQANKTIFDAVSINTASLEIMKEKGMLVKYVSSHDSSYPRGRKDEDGYWTGIYMNTRVIAYNTRLVPPKSAPISYQDLLQPKWRGEKLGLEVSQPHWYGSVLYIMGPEKGLKFLKAPRRAKTLHDYGPVSYLESSRRGRIPDPSLGIRNIHRGTQRKTGASRLDGSQPHYCRHFRHGSGKNGQKPKCRKIVLRMDTLTRRPRGSRCDCQDPQPEWSFAKPTSAHSRTHVLQSAREPYE